jgi:hypothetical protein
VVVLAVSAIGTKKREWFVVFAFPSCYLRKGERGVFLGYLTLPLLGRAMAFIVVVFTLLQ